MLHTACQFACLEVGFRYCLRSQLWSKLQSLAGLW